LLRHRFDDHGRRAASRRATSRALCGDALRLPARASDQGPVGACGGRIPREPVAPVGCVPAGGSMNAR